MEIDYHTAMSDTPALSIADFQRFIRDRYYETDNARGTPGTFMWFVEEIGELATALHGDDRANIHEEFADVLAWLATLANINGVDLEEAIRQKYFTDGGPQGVKH